MRVVLLGQHADAPGDPARRRSPPNLLDDRRRARGADDEQEREALRGELSPQQAHRVHEVQDPLLTLHLAHEGQEGSVGGETQRQAQGGAVVGGPEPVQVHAAPDGAKFPRGAGGAREPPPRVVRIADHPVGQTLEEWVEGVVRRLADEPDHFGGRAQLGEPAGDGIARRIGRDDVDVPLPQEAPQTAARAPDPRERAGFDMVERDIGDRTVERLEMIRQLTRPRTDDHRFHYPAIEVLDQQHHTALAAHPQVGMVAHKGRAYG